MDVADRSDVGTVCYRGRMDVAVRMWEQFATGEEWMLRIVRMWEQFATGEEWMLRIVRMREQFATGEEWMLRILIAVSRPRHSSSISVVDR